MSNEALRPSTLVGIKRLAKSLKTQRGIQHSQALNEAAKAAGFQNFSHARRALPTSLDKVRPRQEHCLFLSAYWKSQESGDSGRETITIGISAPWVDLIAPHQFQNHRALWNFRADGPDHLARDRLLRTQSEARRAVCAAARTMQFMDATKLRPAKSHSRAFPGGRASNTIPGRDHSSVWYDPESKRYLITDEPYEMAVERRAEEREAWAKRFGFAIVKPKWTGMYAPEGGSQLYLVSDETKGIPLQSVAAALNKLPAPLVEGDWNGESAPIVPWFISPGTRAKNAADRDKPKTPRRLSGQRKSVGYVQAFVGPRRRPKARMPIEAHAEAGRLLKSVLNDTYYRKGSYNRIDAVRCELDEWAQCEYSQAELPNEQFFDLYYHDSRSTFSRSLTEAVRGRHIQSLVQVKQILEQHYPECPPLKSLLRKVDSAVKSLQSWT